MTPHPHSLLAHGFLLYGYDGKKKKVPAFTPPRAYSLVARLLLSNRLRMAAPSMFSWQVIHSYYKQNLLKLSGDL